MRILLLAVCASFLLVGCPKTEEKKAPDVKAPTAPTAPAAPAEKPPEPAK